MAWLTAAEIQTQYPAFQLQTTIVIGPFLADAISRVESVMGRRYDVSLWATTTPSMANAWVRRLTYAYFLMSPHIGPTADSGGSVGKTIRDDVEQEMKDELAEELPMLYEDGTPVPLQPAPDFPSANRRTLLLRTLRPAMGMGPPERDRVLLPGSNGNVSTSRWR